MEIVLFIWVACGIAAAVIASNKGGSGCLWFGLGILFGPFGVLAAAVMGRDARRDVQHGLMEGHLRLCPFCSEAIQSEAKVCRFCGRDVPPPKPRTTMEMLRGAPKR